MSRIIALCDVNNCFASSEIVFAPELYGKAMVVLSNNDGCAIARSKEAKQLGVKMAQPYFQFKHLEKSGLIIKSANFSLYTNLSERIRSVLETFSASVVPYSIDESFIDLSGINIADLEKQAKSIQLKVLKHTGMPVGIGVAESKTLSKAANWAAKKYPKTNGIVNITGNQLKRQKLLHVMPVGEVWGVGKQTTKKLNAMGVTTALELANINCLEVKKLFGVVLERTVKELCAVESLPWQPDYLLNKQIIASRSLGEKTNDQKTLFAAISNHVSRASKKLRDQQAVTQSITIFVRNNPYSKKAQTGDRFQTIRLVQPTSDNRVLLQAARKAFDKMGKLNYLYATAGCVLEEIMALSAIQADLFLDTSSNQKESSLMSTLDDLNERFGKGTVKSGSESMSCAWQSRSEWKSKDYTGNWKELPVAKC